MRRVTLGKTGMTVSALCLGSMTWGRQNTEAEGHAQMDMALAAGVDFWDTAEIYPVNPVTVDRAGRTEEIIGTWLASRGGRDRITLATKAAGQGQALRGGAGLTGAVLRQAVEGSLRRLQTDYIDLFQLHVANRASYHFRNIWTYDPRGADRMQIDSHMLDILKVSAELIAEGKIRQLALSNETVWGTVRWLALADQHGLPRVASVQNEYSLLCRQFDSDWAEFSVHEDIPLLAFSPLGAGLLSGKYAGDHIPPNSRRAANPTLSGRVTPQAFTAVAAYNSIAQRHGLDPCQMAIAFCLSRPFHVIPIIGAASVAQLAVNLGSDLTLSPEVLAEIDAAHRAHPQPY